MRARLLGVVVVCLVRVLSMRVILSALLVLLSLFVALAVGCLFIGLRIARGVRAWGDAEDAARVNRGPGLQYGAAISSTSRLSLPATSRAAFGPELRAPLSRPAAVPLTAEAQSIVERLLAIDPSYPRIDSARAEAALGGHLEALGIRSFHVRWLTDGGEASVLLPRGVGQGIGAAYRTAWAPIRDFVDRRSGDGKRESPMVRVRRAARQILAQEESAVRAIWAHHDPGGVSVVDLACVAALAIEWSCSLQADTEREDGVDWSRVAEACVPCVEALEAGLWRFWPTDDAVMTLGRPSIMLDGNRAFHCADGPAISWAGEGELYFWHGIRVPSQAILVPETLTLRDILAEPNLEVRRVLVERLGVDRLLAEAGATPCDADEFGTLYRVQLARDQPIVVVKVLDATPAPDGVRREYFLRVPSWIRTARQAVAWTFGLNEREYQPIKET